MSYIPTQEAFNDAVSSGGYEPTQEAFNSAISSQNEPDAIQKDAVQKNPTMHDLLGSLLKGVRSGGTNDFMKSVLGSQLERIILPHSPTDPIKDVLIGANKPAEWAGGVLFGSPKSGIEKTLGMEHPGSLDRLLQGSVSYGPFGAVGRGVASGLGALRVPLSKFIGSTAAGGAYGLSQAPEGQEGESALVSALINAITHGAGAGINAIKNQRPSVKYRGQLTPEELRENLRVADEHTGLGDIVQNPNLKHDLENELSREITTGVSEKYAGTAKRIHGEANALFDEFSGGVHETQIPQKNSESVNKAAENLRKEKNDHYSVSNRMADDLGFNVETPEFLDFVNSNKHAINNSNVLHLQQPAIDILKKLNIYSGIEGNIDHPKELLDRIPLKESGSVPIIDPATGKVLLNSRTSESMNPATATYDQEFYPAEKPGLSSNSKPIRNSYDPKIDIITGKRIKEKSNLTLQEANILKGSLISEGRKLSRSILPADKYYGGVLMKLGTFLKGDINSSLDNFGHEGLKGSYAKAEKNYADNYSQLLDDDINQFTHGNEKSDDLLRTFIIGGKNDNGKQLQKLMRLIPEEDHNLIRAGYFRQSMTGPERYRSIHPTQMATQWSKLGPNQKIALVPDQSMRQRLDDLVKKVGMNGKALKLMFNPETGVTANTPLAKMKVIGQMMAGGSLGGVPGAIAAAVLPAIGRKYKADFLTSPTVREKLIAKMIANDNKPKGKSYLPETQNIAQSLAQLLQQGS